MAEPLLRTAWRRRTLVLMIIAVTAGAAAAVSMTLDEVYEANSRLLIVQPERVGDLGGIQAAQITARTYSEILRSPNIRRIVDQGLAATGAPAAAAGRVTIRPVPETQLITVTAEGPDKASARRLADTYAQVVVEYAEERLEETTGARLSLADAATVRADPIRPRPELYILLAALVGVPLGIAAAVLRDRADARVRTAHEMEEAFGVPVLARIPNRGRSPADEAAFREAVRLLRVSLGHVVPVRAGHSIAITSATSGEGKSTITHALAVAASEAGQRVVVVEGDVQRGVQARFLRADVRAQAPGLTDVLAGFLPLEEALARTLTKNVLLLPVGRVTGPLSAVLDSNQARALLAMVGEHADLVLIDCPPLRAGADASVLAASASSVLLVARMGRASRPDVAQALQQLERVEATVAGCVVNADPLRAEPYEYARDPRDRAATAA